LLIKNKIVKKIIWIVIILFIGLTTYTLWPICNKLTSENLQSFNVPIEQRTDRDINLMKVFEQKADGWYQCKARLSRWFFF